MKTRILKKINQQVRITEKNGMFEVECIPYGYNDWQLLNVISTIDKAIKKKHNYTIMIILRDLGYRSKLINRRKKRKSL